MAQNVLALKVVVLSKDEEIWLSDMTVAVIGSETEWKSHP